MSCSTVARMLGLQPTMKGRERKPAILGGGLHYTSVANSLNGLKFSKNWRKTDTLKAKKREKTGTLIAKKGRKRAL